MIHHRGTETRSCELNPLLVELGIDRACFERDGCHLVVNAIDARALNLMREEIDSIDQPLAVRSRNGAAYAIRDVFSASPKLLAYARDGVLADTASTLLGASSRPIKATLFDKRPEANWSLPLHQDLTIAVEKREDVSGYGPWTEKAGVPHVQPPEAVLRLIVALRIHLDDCPVENGALRVVRGSHKLGKIESERLGRMAPTLEVEAVGANAGDILAMSPLLVHGSGKSTTPGRRRVLHIEYSCVELPAPLRWPEWFGD